MFVDRHYPRPAHASRVRRRCPNFKFFAWQRHVPGIPLRCAGFAEANSTPGGSDRRRRSQAGLIVDGSQFRVVSDGSQLAFACRHEIQVVPIPSTPPPPLILMAIVYVCADSAVTMSAPSLADLFAFNSAVTSACFALCRLRCRPFQTHRVRPMASMPCRVES